MSTCLIFLLALSCWFASPASCDAQNSPQPSTKSILKSSTTQPALHIRQASTDEIELAVQRHSYQPVLKNHVLKAIQNASSDASANGGHDIINATYQAILNTGTELNGEFKLVFSGENKAIRTLGPTNLQDLKFLNHQQQFTLGKTTDKSAVLLVPADVRNVEGYWMSEGQQQSGAIVFDLQLPLAVSSNFKLTTSQDVIVTSPNSLVVSSDEITDRERKDKIWTLYPPRSGRLTINCSNRLGSFASADRNISAQADYKVRPGGCDTRWNLNLPGLPVESEIQFNFSEAFTPQSIIGAGQSVLPFSWDAEQKLLTLKNSTESSLSAIVITGRFLSPKPNTCLLPVLNRGRWKDSNSEIQGQLKLSSATLRVSFSSDIAIQSSKLSGLMETDVEFTADGSQRLTLDQFGQPAAAKFQLLLPAPVLQDEVVTQTTDERGQIEALIRIENRSGVAETIRYEVPRKYRVTAVRELDTQLPLLFRIVPGDSTAITQPIEIFFRSPLARGSQQLLQLRLQSTANEVNLAEAELKNSNYLRLTDAVVLNAARLPSGMNETEGTDYAEFREQNPWVPAAEGAVVFNRSELPKIAAKSDKEFVVTASIDHTLSVADQSIDESIQIRLAATPSLPSEIILQAADSGHLKLKPFDQQLGYSLQRRISSRSSNEWILRLPLDEQKIAATVTMECERPATGRHIPMLVSLPSTNVQTADIRVIDPSADWSLIDNEGQSVGDAIGYPERPLETGLRIQVRNSRDHSEQVHGTATWLLDQSPDAIRAEILIQLSVFGLADRISLDVSGLTAQRIHCLVNERRTEVEIQDGQLDVLLPEDGRDSQIQILIVDVRLQVDSAARLELPSIRLKNSSLRGIDTIITPPSGRTVTATNTTAVIKIEDGITNPGNAIKQSPSPDVQHFLARLTFRQAQVESLFLTFTPSRKPLVVTLGQAHALLVSSTIAGCLLIVLLTTFVPNRPIAWAVIGLGILLAQSIRIAFSDLAQTAAIITAAIAAAGAIIYFKDRSEQEPNVLPKSSPLRKSVAIGILVLLSATSQAAVAQTPRPQATQVLPPQLQNDILTLEQDSPIVFVPPQLALLLGSPNEDSAASPIFLDSQVQIQLLTEDSISANMTFHIAVNSAIDQQIELPVADVTLINCRLNDSPILPITSDSGSPSILIPAIPQPAPRLAPNSKVIATTMKGWVAGLKVYEVSYTVRIMARPEVAGAKAELPLPPAPLTRITVLDQTESVTEARLFTPKLISGVRLGSEFNYPIFSNLTRVEVQFQFANSAVDEKQPPQESEIVAKVFATPTGLKIDCDYEVRAVDARSKSVRVSRLSKMNLIRAESDDGTVVIPSGDDDILEIPTPVNRLGLQKFKLAWQMPLTFVQEVSINTQELRQLNRIPADRLILTAITSDRFTIASIHTEQGPLEPIPEDQRPAKLVLRQNEQPYDVPATVDTVTIQLVRLLETREASLSQSAVVERNQINWNCECELQIPNEPIFRQNLTVSSDLKIQSITAKSEDIDRLQSWYRDGDQLVVCLREATRGSLAITINGVLPRHSQLDTSLPVITLPESVEILEFSLLLSASDPESVFIRSLEGTIPNAQFQTEAAAVPTTPIRFYVTDEERPLIIRAEPTKAAQATVVALLSEQDDQTQIAIFMAFKAVESPFNLRLSRPSNVAYATSKVLLLPAEGSVTSSDDAQQSVDISAEGFVEDNDLSVVVITGIVPAMTSSILTVPLPVFETSCNFESFRVLDGRGQNGVTAVPRWIRNILPELPNATSPGNTDLLPMTVSPSGDQMRIQLPLTTSAQDNSSEENVPAFAITTHSIQGDEQSVKGTFGTLAFSPAANATLKITLPLAARLIQMQIDGLPAPFQIDDNGTVTVTLVDRTCLVEMEWLQSVPQHNMLRSSQIQLPVLSNVEGSVFINQRLPGIGWRPRSVVAGPIQVAGLLTEITSGLQIIGTGLVASSSQLPNPNANPNQPQQDPLTGDPAWIELRSQSVDTAEAYAQLLQKIQSTQPELILNRLSSPTPVIEIRQQFPASSLFIILAAVGLLIAGLTARSSSKPVSVIANTKVNLEDTEGSTEIHRTARP